jgi:cbb3-type cytochrome c oxidase subunit III
VKHKEAGRNKFLLANYFSMKKAILFYAAILVSCQLVPTVNYEEKTKDTEYVGKGQAVFKKNCVACHGELLDGLVGPDLTDERWKYGDGTVTAIMDTVTQGVEKNGMPSWKEKLSAEEIEMVAVFVRSKRGSNANAEPKESFH